MIKSPLAWLVLLSLFLAGCAGSSSSTAVNADGSWARTLKLTVRQAPSFGDDKQNKWPETFAMPAGSEWAKSEEIKDGEKVTTLKRSFAPGGEPVTDVIIKGKTGTMFKNFVMVRKLEGNRLEDYEKIVMVGPKSARADRETNEFIKELKEALPAGKATDDDLKAIGKKTEVALTRILFGPDDHIFGMMLTNLDGAVHRIRNKVGAIEIRILADQLGNRLTDEERSATVKKLIDKFDKSDMMDPKKSGASSDPTDNDSSFVGMSVAVKLPGKVVETNAEIDEYTGEIYWDFMSNSAEPDVLELRAVCQI